MRPAPPRIRLPRHRPIPIIIDSGPPFGPSPLFFRPDSEAAIEQSRTERIPLPPGRGYRRDLHRRGPPRHRGAAHVRGKGPDYAGLPGRRGERRVAEDPVRAQGTARGHRQPHPRHDPCDQRHHRAKRGQDGLNHNEGLSRRRGDRDREALRPVRPLHGETRAAGPARPPLRGDRAPRSGRKRPHAPGRGRGQGCHRRTPEHGRRGHRGHAPAFLPESRPRAAH